MKQDELALTLGSGWVSQNVHYTNMCKDSATKNWSEKTEKENIKESAQPMLFLKDCFRAVDSKWADPADAHRPEASVLSTSKVDVQMEGELQRCSELFRQDAYLLVPRYYKKVSEAKRTPASSPTGARYTNAVFSPVSAKINLKAIAYVGDSRLFPIPAQKYPAKLVYFDAQFGLFKDTDYDKTATRPEEVSTTLQSHSYYTSYFH